MLSLTRRTVLAAGGALAMPAIIRLAWAADTVKLGCLFSSSGTMANLEGRILATIGLADRRDALAGVRGAARAQRHRQDDAAALHGRAVAAQRRPDGAAWQGDRGLTLRSSARASASASCRRGATSSPTSPWAENLTVSMKAQRMRDPAVLEEVCALFPVLRTMWRRGALMGKPRLLLLDEPTEGIQPSIVKSIKAVIAGLRGRMSILLVEQYYDFACSLADR